jgi:hypothetical protein
VRARARRLPPVRRLAGDQVDHRLDVLGTIVRQRLPTPRTMRSRAWVLLKARLRITRTKSKICRQRAQIRAD